MKPTSKSVVAGPPSSSVPVSSSSVKYELLTFRSAQPPQPIRFEFGPGKETFTVDLPTDQNDGTTRQQTWGEWKRRALEHPVVRAHFKSSAALHYGEFAFRLPGGASGEWIGPESLKDSQEAETKLLLRVAGASSTTSSILFLYAPQIHLCTFDGIKFSASCFGHWLSASDTKTHERLKKLENDDSVCPNDWLLKEKHQSDFARLLYRIALFMKEDLGLGAEGYIISVPFGEYVFADGDGIGRSEVRARVQVTDVRIFWTLLLKFEEKLNDEDRTKRLEYFVHQRQAWIDARSSDYKRWASQEAASVRAALEALTPTAPATTQFKLPKNCAWDEYGRMQLCLKMLSPICDMVGQMGAISLKLKNVVGGVQMAAQLTGTSGPNHPVSINVSARADQCLVLLPADRYMSVLTRANADPKAWGAALLDALRDAPDRLYSGLLNETSGLYQCSKEDLGKIDECLLALAPRPPGYKGLAKIVDTSALPVSTDIIRSLESKNHTDKRLFLERAMESKGITGPLPGLTPSVEKPTAAAVVHQPTIWEKKRAAAAPPPQTVAPVAPREPIPLPANPDREDLQMKQPQNDDFARFDGDAVKPPVLPATGAAGPRPPPAVIPAIKAVLQRPQQAQGLTDRAPPPTVGTGFGAPPQQQQQQRRAPPRVFESEVAQPQSSAEQQQYQRALPPSVKPESRPPPPQVKQAPPTVFAPKKSVTPPAPAAPVGDSDVNLAGINGSQQDQGRSRQNRRNQPQQNQPRSSSVEGDRDWRNKPVSAIPQQEQVNPAHQQTPQTQRVNKDFQSLDREDRGYDVVQSNTGAGGVNRGRGTRGRGRGGGRGAFNSRGSRPINSNFDNEDGSRREE